MKMRLINKLKRSKIVTKAIKIANNLRMKMKTTMTKNTKIRRMH